MLVWLQKTWKECTLDDAHYIVTRLDYTGKNDGFISKSEFKLFIKQVEKLAKKVYVEEEEDDQVYEYDQEEDYGQEEANGEDVEVEEWKNELDAKNKQIKKLEDKVK